MIVEKRRWLSNSDPKTLVAPGGIFVFMALQSQLFRGDLKLEAAANMDSAHITRGARGQHVEKLQTSLNVLDLAGLNVDGSYGTATATAVLNYKTKRKIINQAYQKTADNIVGKMTMAKLDEEMRAYETKPAGRIKFIPISPRANREKAYPRVKFQLLDSNARIPVRTAHVLPVESITIEVRQTAEIEVKNGDGYQLMLYSMRFDTQSTARLIPPGSREPVELYEISGDSVIIKIKGMLWGTAWLEAYHPRKLSDSEKLVVNVRDQREDVIYHPTPAHHHEPVSEPNEWNKVCEEAARDPNLGFTLKTMAKQKVSPRTVAEAALLGLLGKRMATFHYNYYLTGKGGVVNEDENLKEWIEGDSNARKVIARRISDARRGSESPVKTMFHFDQQFYGDDDARSSFGGIPNLEVLADFVMGTVEIWFEDIYEWHPTYSQYIKPMKCDITAARDTIFLHAALVQMKSRGAKSFQMRGRAKFPMKSFPGL